MQEYVKSPDSSITRVEFVGGEYVYSVRVDTSEGFELCPADACQIGDLYCPVGEEPKDQMKFRIYDNQRTELIEKYKQFLKGNSIDVAGIEFIVDEEGAVYTYDVNTNTNYNSDAEELEQKFGMLELAKLLGRELESLNERVEK